MDEGTQELLRTYVGQPLADIPEITPFRDLVQGNLDTLARIYDQHGVTVHPTPPVHR